MKQTSKSTYRKSFLRNVEIPLASSKSQVLKPQTATESVTSCRAPAKHRISTDKASDKFKQPELHSTLNVRKEIEKVKSTHSKAPTSIGELTPKSKKIVREQVLSIIINSIQPTTENQPLLNPSRSARNLIFNTMRMSSKDWFL